MGGLQKPKRHKNSTVSIIGYGRVGKAVEKLVSGHCNVKIDEKEADIIFICVPTPSKEDGSCDTSIVEEVIKDCEADLIVIKSTVAPGTTQKFDKPVVFSPEYIGESSYYNPYFNDDMIDCPFVIVGGDEALCDMYIDLLLPIMGPTKKYFKTTSMNAEIIKYMENAFFATKIAFVNEMKQYCDKVGACWHDVREGWLLDPRINPMHTMALGKFGGKCLPKDVKAIQKESGSTLLKEVLKWLKS